jgi:hypothetical protein
LSVCERRFFERTAVGGVFTNDRERAFSRLILKVSRAAKRLGELSGPVYLTRQNYGRITIAGPAAFSYPVAAALPVLALAQGPVLVQRQALEPRVLALEQAWVLALARGPVLAREQAWVLALARGPVLVQRQALEPQVLARARVADVLPPAQAEVLRAGPAVAAGQAESQDGLRLQVRLPVAVLLKGPAVVAELPA